MQFLHAWKKYGPRAACHALAYKIAKRCIVLDVTHLMVLDVAQLPRVDDVPAEFRPLGFAEVLEWSANSETDLDRAIACRLQGDLDICFGAFVGNQLAGYLWLAFDSIEAVHNRGDSEATGVAMSFREDAVFLYKAFVQPQFRGRRLYADLMHAAGCWIYQHHGVRFVIATTDWTNYSALRSCHRQGFRSLGRVWRFGVPGWMKTVGPRSAASRGISFGRDTEVTPRSLAAASGRATIG